VRRGAITSTLVLVGFLALASGALAGGKIGFSGRPGTHRPPAKLGGFLMKKFGADNRPLGNTVTFVRGPTGKVRFSQPLNHARVGSGWSTGQWVHGRS